MVRPIQLLSDRILTSQPEGIWSLNLNFMKRLTIVTVLAIFMVTACQEQERMTPVQQVPQADKAAIDNFIRFIDFNQKQLMKQPSLSKEQVTQVVVASIPEFEKQYGINLTSSDTPKQFTAGRRFSYDGLELQIMQDMVAYAETSYSESQYLDNISGLNSQVLSSDLPYESKVSLLTQIGLQQSLVSYMGQLALYAQETPRVAACDGWWGCWGKCAAGIIGSAGMGALSGANIGGVGCTVVLPVVGTVACGTAGAVVGAIFGGFAGGARACD